MRTAPDAAVSVRPLLFLLTLLLLSVPLCWALLRDGVETAWGAGDLGSEAASSACPRPRVYRELRQYSDAAASRLEMELRKEIASSNGRSLNRSRTDLQRRPRERNPELWRLFEFVDEAVPRVIAELTAPEGALLVPGNASLRQTNVDLFPDDLHLAECWTSLHLQGAPPVEQHCHFPFAFSWVFYVLMPPDGAPLILEAEKITPRQSELVVFSGAVMHSVPRHMSASPRLIVTGSYSYTPRETMRLDLRESDGGPRTASARLHRRGYTGTGRWREPGGTITGEQVLPETRPGS